MRSLAPPADAMAPKTKIPNSGLYECIKRFSRPSLSVTAAEIPQVHKLAVICDKFMEQRVQALVQGCGNRPLLRSYSSDGTPIKTQYKMRKTTDKVKVTRAGKAVKEYLIQVAFFREAPALGGRPTSVVRFKPPLAMTHGKTASAQFAAGLEFGPTLR